MEGYRGDQGEVMSAGRLGKYKAEVKERIERRERLALRNKAESKKKHLEIYRGLREGIGIKSYLHSPMDFAKTLKLRFRVGDLELARKKKEVPGIPVRSREEEEIDAHMCPCGVELT